MNEILMVKGAKRVVETCVGVRPGEQVLIVTEGEKLPIAQAVAQAVYAVDAEPMIALMLIVLAIITYCPSVPLMLVH